MRNKSNATLESARRPETWGLRRLKFHAATFYFRHISSRKNRSALARGLSRLLRSGHKRYRQLTAPQASRNLDVIQPSVREVNVSLTSKCIYGCIGCSYGRSFLPGQQLDPAIAHRLIDDLRELSIPRIYFYGGEPLLHPDVVDFIEYAYKKGIHPILGTNGLLLSAERAAALYRAGLRTITIGIYGIGPDYDLYVDRAQSFERLQKNISVIKTEYPDIRISLAWLLMKPTCNLESLHAMWDFAKRNRTPFSINLIHYDFPYFSDGHDHELQLFEKDRPSIDEVVRELIRLKQQQPELMENTVTGLRSIPDWLIRKEKMRVPCNMHDNIWVGPDGTVQVCQKNSVLGNLKNSQLREMLYTKEHVESAQACFALQCSNCHVRFDSRTREHPESYAKYGS